MTLFAIYIDITICDKNETYVANIFINEENAETECAELNKLFSNNCRTFRIVKIN